MGIDLYPPPEVDPNPPLQIVGRNFVPGSSGWKISDVDAELEKLTLRRPTTVKTPTIGTEQASLLAFARSYAGVDPRGTQVLIKCESYVGTPSGGVLRCYFNYPFPNTCWIVVACFGDSPGLSTFYLGSSTATYFDFASGSGVGMRVNYVAIGY